MSLAVQLLICKKMIDQPIQWDETVSHMAPTLSSCVTVAIPVSSNGQALLR